MPATEQTWRNQKQLHVWFGVSGLLMLVSTLWMFVEDHDRPWKNHQRTMRSADQRLTSWRLQQEDSDTKVREQNVLRAKIEEVRQLPPDEQLLKEFAEKSIRAEIDVDFWQSQLNAPSIPTTADLLTRMESTVQQARNHEINTASAKKFQGAANDEARSHYNLAVTTNRPDEVQEELLQKALVQQEKLSEFTLVAQKAEAIRKELQAVMTSVRAAETALQKELGDSGAEANRLSKLFAERNSTYFTSTFPWINQRFLEWPILDAFNSPLKIDNLWTENLTIPYGSFGEVRRFDRCTTCHQSIDKTLPGMPSDGAYLVESEIVLRLTVPEKLPAPAEAVAEPDPLEARFGIKMANRGLIEPAAATVQFVRAESPAATAEIMHSDDLADTLAGVRTGDIISHIGDDKIVSKDQLRLYLNNAVEEGQTFDVTVRRGLPHPYASHPRLDLFVGSLSPHPKTRVGCTACHGGQGTATEFKWASHAPNDPEQGHQWFQQYGWFENHHWLFPMYPERFAESSCLTCHHSVIELRPSERFPIPPAPKLMQGYDLVAKYGCFSCHEINGYRGDRTIGPDLRTEPNYFAAAAQIAQDPSFGDLEAHVQEWAHQVARYPDDNETRRNLYRFVKDDSKSEEPVLSTVSHKLGAVLEDVDHPGLMRKPGPSLRHVASKLGATFLYDWIRDPRHFRPTTRMPRFFGNWKHLDDNGRAISERYEPIEILGTVRYLLDKSQSVEAPYEPDGEAWDDVAVERGQRTFELRGCLSCHQHGDFPEFRANQGPDLTNIGDKFNLEDTPDGKKWLFNWLKNPSNYHVRTSMPDLQLTPIQDADGQSIDPAADIAAYLLSSSKDWQPHAETLQGLQLNADSRQALVDLARDYLNKAYYRLEVDAFLGTADEPGSGVPAARARGPELELVTADGTSLTEEQLLRYIGSKTIYKYGCNSCHDIPGFEDAKPIGTALADWGLKETSKIAFEHIVEYLHHGHGHPSPGAGEAHDQDDAGVIAMNPDSPHATDGQGLVSGESRAAGQSSPPFDESFYIEKLEEHDRAGFIWQKLKEPRSYDFKMTETKDYNDRLRMPQFPFTPEQREAVVTFVLGLVAQPPAEEFVYHPEPRAEAMLAGQRVLERFNCAGCHILRAERWEVEFEPGALEPPPSEPSYPFVNTPFSSDQIGGSQKVDSQRGTLTATLYGMRERSEDGLPVVWDAEENALGPEELESGEFPADTLIHRFQLWKPTLLDGQPAELTPAAMSIPARTIRHRFPAWGGDLTIGLLPRVTEYEKEVNPAAKGSEAWAWLPPPLLNEGTKVNADWLHNFLLDPHMIRPATVMRMPKFNMSPDEATALVNFFAARDDAEYPYTFAAVTRKEHLTEMNAEYMAAVDALEPAVRPPGDTRLDHAMNIIVSNNYCIKCHIVGDFEPQASPRAKAPDLSVVYQRLRSDYTRRWIAEPRRILPYTAMPVNIPYSPDAEHQGGVSQQLFHGTSADQVDGLVDLLMNFNTYNQLKNKIAPLVQQAAPATTPNEGAVDGSEVKAAANESPASFPEDRQAVVPGKSRTVAPTAGVSSTDSASAGTTGA